MGNDEAQKGAEAENETLVPALFELGKDPDDGVRRLVWVIRTMLAPGVAARLAMRERMGRAGELPPRAEPPVPSSQPSTRDR